jgi:hypothetical protein
MKIVLAALVLGALPLASQATTFDIKTGAWEVTESTAVSGMLIPKEALDKMSPAQRARAEESMRAHAGTGKPHTSHSCVTRQDLDRGELQHSEKANCTRKVISQTARHLEVEETCTGPDAATIHFRVDATSAESYSGSMDMARGEGGKVHVEMSGRWIGATCTKGVND